MSADRQQTAHVLVDEWSVTAAYSGRRRLTADAAKRLRRRIDDELVATTKRLTAALGPNVTVSVERTEVSSGTSRS